MRRLGGARVRIARRWSRALGHIALGRFVRLDRRTVAIRFRVDHVSEWIAHIIVLSAKIQPSPHKNFRSTRHSHKYRIKHKILLWNQYVRSDGRAVETWTAGTGQWRFRHQDMPPCVLLTQPVSGRPSSRRRTRSSRPAQSCSSRTRCSCSGPCRPGTCPFRTWCTRPRPPAPSRSRVRTHCT